MFDIGFQELVIIFVVALFVFGPKRLPEVGRTFGKWMGELRRGIYNTKRQMESEFDEIQKETGEEKTGDTAAVKAAGGNAAPGEGQGGAPEQEGEGKV